MPDRTDLIQGLQHRTLTARPLVRAADDSNGRTLTGIAVPYNEEIELWPGLREQVAPGAVIEWDPQLWWRHTEPIGVITSAEDTETGWAVTATISDTTQGRDAATLLRDGAVSSLSIGFIPVETLETHDDDSGTVTLTHQRIKVREVSIVPHPAYSGATITEVRSTNPHQKETTMPEDTLTRADFDGLTDDLNIKLTDMQRRLDQLATDTTPSDSDQLAALAVQFRSMGEWVAAVANDRHEQHDVALALHRAVTTSNIPAKLTGTPGFIGDLTRKITARRRWIERFTTRSLPAKGMTVDYLKTEVTATVAEQTNQLDALTNTSTFKVTPANSPVRTFGGGDTVSRQVIDRMDPWALNALFEAFALAYAKATEAATKTYITAEIEKITSANSPGTTLSIPTDNDVFHWADAIVDAAGIFEDRNFQLDRLAVSPDVFKLLAREAGTDGRPLLSVYGTGMNIVGEMNLPAATGNLMNLPVEVLHGTTKQALFYDPIAIETLESPGAPFWLQEDRALNLARDYACYGYLAHITPHPGALLPVVFS